jgi:hypothetical protein
MRIPGADQAIIDHEKIVQYLLNLDHPDGGPKAVVLAYAGFSVNRPEELESALRGQHLSRAAQKGKSSIFGEKFEILGPLEGPTNWVMIRSIWIIRHGEAVPRLITLIPEKRNDSLIPPSDRDEANPRRKPLPR